MTRKKPARPPESKIIDGELWRRPSSRLKNYGFTNFSRAVHWCGEYREQGYKCKIIPFGRYHVIYRKKK